MEVSESSTRAAVAGYRRGISIDSLGNSSLGLIFERTSKTTKVPRRSRCMACATNRHQMPHWRRDPRGKLRHDKLPGIGLFGLFGRVPVPDFSPDSPFSLRFSSIHGNDDHPSLLLFRFTSRRRREALGEAATTPGKLSPNIRDNERDS